MDHEHARRVFKWLTDGFQAFYDWLVGHSLWQDLWAKVWDVVDSAIIGLVSRLTGGLFDWLKSSFTDTVSAIQGSWNSIVSAVTNSLDTISTKIRGQFPELSKIITGGTEILKGNWMQGISDIAAALPGAWAEITSAISKALSDLNTVLANAWTQMQSAAQSAFNELQGIVNNALSGIAAAANALWNSLTHHSIWPDMMAELVAQTKAGLDAVQGEFQDAFASPTGIIQTVQAGGQATAAASSPAAASATPGSLDTSQAITLPINVYLDGQQIQAFLEKRIVATMVRDASRSKRA